jgi:hypothetical protein
VGKGSTEHAREKRPDASDFTSIPTEDPRAPLQFCQSLAPMLSVGSKSRVNYIRLRQIAGGIKAGSFIPEHQVELSVVIPDFNEKENISVLSLG